MRVNQTLLMFSFLVFLLFSCKQVAESKQATATSDEYLIIPFKGLDKVTPTLKKEKLNEVYTENRLVERVVFSYEGIDILGTEIMFPDSTDNFTIEWNEKTGTPKTIRINSNSAKWQTKGGIGMGSTIGAVQSANGVPFLIYGFESDKYIAGTIKSWESGKLKGLQLQFKITQNLDGNDYIKLIGSKGISSDNPLLKKAGLQVEKISLTFSE